MVGGGEDSKKTKNQIKAGTRTTLKKKKTKKKRLDESPVVWHYQLAHSFFGLSVQMKARACDIRKAASLGRAGFGAGVAGRRAR